MIDKPTKLTKFTKIFFLKAFMLLQKITDRLSAFFRWKSVFVYRKTYRARGARGRPYTK